MALVAQLRNLSSIPKNKIILRENQSQHTSHELYDDHHSQVMAYIHAYVAHTYTHTQVHTQIFKHFKISKTKNKLCHHSMESIIMSWMHCNILDNIITLIFCIKKFLFTSITPVFRVFTITKVSAFVCVHMQNKT